jgi:hypothetical protein
MRDDSAYFGLGCLLLLSIATITLCRRDGPAPTRYAEFLFTGKTFVFSVISSAGAAFSVTYFLGATFIYASILRVWCVPILIAIAVLVIAGARRIVTVAASELRDPAFENSDQNLLLALMQRRLQPRNFSVFVQLLFVSSFLLLVEELSISRVILNSLFPDLPILASTLLFTIVAVILAYVYIGGFRAVLTADWVQFSVLVAFLGLLLFFVSARGHPLAVLAVPRNLTRSTIIGASVLWTVYGATFLLLAVDLYSRMNFSAPANVLLVMRLRLVTISISLVFVVVLIGVVFAISLSPEIGRVLTPTQYYSSLSALFATTPLSHVAFLVAVFCMIFTTVNTLLITTAQIGFYKKGFGSTRPDFSRILVVATFISVFVDADAVCAFGILVGSLLVLPLFQVLPELFGEPGRRQRDDRYLWLGAVLSVAAFIAAYPRIGLRFQLHFLIPGGVLGMTLLSRLIWLGVVQIRRSMT